MEQPQEKSTAYGAYGRQKLFRVLLDLQSAHVDLNWSSMADDIHVTRGIPFQRAYFYRLRDGTLGDSNVEIIVSWIEAKYVRDIRKKLVPFSVFETLGFASRDFHPPPPEGRILDFGNDAFPLFAGTYLCAPLLDKNSYMPLTALQRSFQEQVETRQSHARQVPLERYLSHRSLLVLKDTGQSFFHAAEFPISALYPNDLVSADARMVFEGIAVMASNIILVKLRDCLTRTPRTHTIVVSVKPSSPSRKKSFLNLPIPFDVREIRSELQALPHEDKTHIEMEQELFLNSDYTLSGPSQGAVSPLASLAEGVSEVRSQQQIYYPRPAGFLKSLDQYFIHPELVHSNSVERIISNPLSIGAVTWP